MSPSPASSPASPPTHRLHRNIQLVENFVTLDYATLLELRIANFEPDSSNQMIFEGKWKLQPVGGGETRSHFFRITTPIPTDPSAISAGVNAMNQFLEHLARQIAD